MPKKKKEPYLASVVIDEVTRSARALFNKLAEEKDMSPTALFTLLVVREAEDVFGIDETADFVEQIAREHL